MNTYDESLVKEVHERLTSRVTMHNFDTKEESLEYIRHRLSETDKLDLQVVDLLSPHFDKVLTDDECKTMCHNTVCLSGLNLDPEYRKELCDNLKRSLDLQTLVNSIDIMRSFILGKVCINYAENPWFKGFVEGTGGIIREARRYGDDNK